MEPALLVTDVVMPEMGGVELSRLLTKRLPDMRSLFLSGYSERIEVGKIHQFNAPFLSKPFTIVELCVAVEKALRDPE